MNKVKKILHDLKFFLFSPKADISIQENSKELTKSVRSPLIFAFSIIAVAIFFFIIWGGTAPLDSATIAPGVIILSENNKIVQHLEGGVIEKIGVKDGNFVERGQELLVLNGTNARANLQIILSQLINAKALEERLEAERNKQDHIIFTDALLQSNAKEVGKVLQVQRNIFDSRRTSVLGKIDILNQKIYQHHERVHGLQAQAKSVGIQINLIKEDLDNVNELFDQGLALKSRLLDLKRKYEELESRKSDIKSSIATSIEVIGETKLEILNTQNDFQHSIHNELKDAEAQALDLQEKYRATLDVLERTIIKAPRSGIVHNLKYHTINGVIAPGSDILNIIPQDDKLLVEAKVNPQDINDIHIGLEAKVQLSAYKTRLVPRLTGKVIYISADRIYDPQSAGIGMMPYYYIIKVEIALQAIEEINYDVVLYPGMPADVFIVKGTRTFLQYLVSPIKDSFHRAFKEE